MAHTTIAVDLAQSVFQTSHRAGGGHTVPGVGWLTATALIALVADIRRFPSGRHFASCLGLTRREASSALRRRLGARAGCHAPSRRTGQAESERAHRIVQRAAPRGVLERTLA
jgi:transposase